MMGCPFHSLGLRIQRPCPAGFQSCPCTVVTYLLSCHVDYTIEYYSEAVSEEILSLPDTLAARFIILTRRISAIGPNLGSPHTAAFGDGLFELQLKGQEGIARVFFCALVGRRVMMLHSFVKKTQKTPSREIEIARKRMKEVKHGNSWSSHCKADAQARCAQ